MKIGIISDTHGSYKYFKMAHKYLLDCDHIIHCGDILYGTNNDLDKIMLSKEISKFNNITFVKGNCDSNLDSSLIKKDFSTLYITIQLNGYNFFITHGHHYSYLSMIYKAKELNCNIICYGHTHIKDISFDGEIQIINPGSIGKPRDGSHSIVILDNDIINVIDIEKNVILCSKKIFEV